MKSQILLHIVDISHPNYQQHIDSVDIILNEINCGDKETILVFNKVDKLKNMSLKNSKTKIYISAIEKLNFDFLKNCLYEKVSRIHEKRFPYNNYLYPKIES